MSQTAPLAAHPRLYVGPAELEHVNDTARWPVLQAAAQRVADAADRYCGDPDFQFNPHQHNSLLIRARMMQTHIVTLLVRWRQTNEDRYRTAVIEHVRQMDRWRFWSWIAMRRGDDAPEAIFDLSYGENSATLAIAYTLLHPTLADDEAALFHDIAARRALRPYLAHVGAEKPPGWFCLPDSNWNSVCTGGAGMLALAMHAVLDEAPAALERTETSIIPFMNALEANDGAWPEGVGYWNYGMRYAFMYLLSHERATGKAHPLLEQPSTKATLQFPLDFSPHGVACSFGDVNRWCPLPFHYAAAHRLGCDELIAALDSCPADESQSRWPNDAELLLLHPRPAAAAADAPVRRHVLRHYAGQDWCVLADRWPEPNLYASVRGGTTEVPHGHLDLMSFHLLAGRERLLRNAEAGEYLDTTFSPRRQELFEISPQGKNALLINGVGIAAQTRVDTRTIETPALNGVRIDATEAMADSRDSKPAAKQCVRVIAMLNDGQGGADDVVLVLDYVELPHVGRLEARYLTPGTITLQGEHAAHLAGEHAQLHAAFACNVPATLHTAGAPLTSPDRTPPLHMLRWCTRDLHDEMIMAAAFCVNQAVALHLAVDESRIRIDIERGGRRTQVTAAADLNDVRC